MFGKYDKLSNGVTPIVASIILLLDFVALASGEMGHENLSEKKKKRKKKKEKEKTGRMLEGGSILLLLF